MLPVIEAVSQIKFRDTDLQQEFIHTNEFKIFSSRAELFDDEDYNTIAEYCDKIPQGYKIFGHLDRDRTITTGYLIPENIAKKLVSINRKSKLGLNDIHFLSILLGGKTIQENELYPIQKYFYSVQANQLPREKDISIVKNAIYSGNTYSSIFFDLIEFLVPNNNDAVITSVKPGKYPISNKDSTFICLENRPRYENGIILSNKDRTVNVGIGQKVELRDFDSFEVLGCENCTILWVQ